MASRISHRAARSWRSFSRLIWIRATGMIRPERISRIVVATTSSIKVKPDCFLRTYIFTGNELGSETCMKTVVGPWSLVVRPVEGQQNGQADDQGPMTDDCRPPY